jgi:hypothetical protein
MVDHRNYPGGPRCFELEDRSSLVYTGRYIVTCQLTSDRLIISPVKYGLVLGFAMLFTADFFILK